MHIETARESEAKNEDRWEKNRKPESPNASKPDKRVDMTGVTDGTRDVQHENSDRVGRGDKSPTEVNSASEAAEGQYDRSHSKGVTEKKQGAVADRTIDHASKITLGRHVSSETDGKQEREARSKFVKSAKAKNDEVFGK